MISEALFDLTGRVAAVTGAASGLGRVIARGLATYGADVACLDVNETGAGATCSDIEGRGRRAFAVRCDVGDPSEVREAFGRVRATLGPVTILVNDAYIHYRSRPIESDPQKFMDALRVNVVGYLNCAQAAAGQMIEAGRGGSIVNLSSIAGTLALGRGNLAYSTSKGAVNQLTRELAVEWAKHGIRVNAIQPCQFKTPGMEQELLKSPLIDAAKVSEQFLKGIPLGRLGEPEVDIVGPAVFLASDASSMVTGVCLPVDGGNLALNAGGSLDW